MNNVLACYESCSFFSLQNAKMECSFSNHWKPGIAIKEQLFLGDPFSMFYENCLVCKI